MFERSMLKPINGIIRSETRLLDKKSDLHGALCKQYSELGWPAVKKEKLVSWGIAEYMNMHRIILETHKGKDDSQIQRHRNETLAFFFEDCVAQFTRACIDLWLDNARVKPEINVDVQRNFEIRGSRQGMRPDVFISSKKQARPVIVIECKTGQGFQRDNWTRKKWGQYIKQQGDKVEKYVLPNPNIHSAKYLYVMLFWYPPKNWMRDSAEELKKENVYILLNKGPNYKTAKEYRDNCKEKGEQIFLHAAEDFLQVIKSKLRL